MATLATTDMNPSHWGQQGLVCTCAAWAKINLKENMDKLFSSQRAFICNFREHWLTIRRLGAQWFNLNSLLTGPELISDTFLALTLAQLQRDGYSIYLVVGELPDCQVSPTLKLSHIIHTIFVTSND